MTPRTRTPNLLIDLPRSRFASKEDAAKRIFAIRLAIETLPYTQSAVAEEAKIKAAHLNRILKGKVATPELWTLIRIERAIDTLKARFSTAVRTLNPEP